MKTLTRLKKGVYLPARKKSGTKIVRNNEKGGDRMKSLFYFIMSILVVKVFFPVAAGGIGEAFIKLIAIINRALDSITV